MVLLLVLAPICAEYLAAYDSSTGHPVQLLGGLLVFTPLYGCPALLIRELARRAGLGWTGILLLGTGFGLVQAGLVDQSLFNDDYRAIEGWDALFRGTFVPGVGVSAVNALNFVGGHAIYSTGAPIALSEAVRPQRASRPWLGRPALLLVALAWVAASAFVALDTLRTETFRASPVQLGGTALLVAVLVLVASRARPRRAATPRPAPPLWLTALVVLPLALVNAMAPEDWLGVVLNLLAFALAVAAGLRAGGNPGWDARHVAVAAAVPLLVRAGLAFTYDPLVGEVAAPAKYGHNVAMALLVLGVTLLALRARREVFEPEVGSVTSGA